MATTIKRQIDIIINTLLNSSGIDKTLKKLDAIRKKTDMSFGNDLTSQMNRFNSGINDARKELSNLEQFQKISKQADRAGLSVKNMGQEFQFVDKMTGQVMAKTTALNRIDLANQPIKTFKENLGEAAQMMSQQQLFTGMQDNARRAGLDLQRVNNELVFMNKQGKRIPLSEGLKKTQIEAEKVRNSFDMAYLSILFFGMALQRLFMNIIRSGVGVYQKMVKNNTEASNAFTHLSANVELLKFTIGEAIGTALLPLLPAIINVVQAITNWINKNPMLTSTLLVGGAALGTFILLVGQFGLAIPSILKKLTDWAVSMRLISASTVATGGVIGAFLSGFAKGFLEVFKFVGKQALLFFKGINSMLMKIGAWRTFMTWIATQWTALMTFLSGKMALFRKLSAAEIGIMAGKFVGFGLLGYAVGKLFHNGLKEQLSKFFQWGGKALAAYSQAIVDTFSEIGTHLGGIFVNIGRSLKNLITGDFSGAISSAKDAISDAFSLNKNASIWQLGSFWESFNKEQQNLESAQAIADDYLILKTQLQGVKEQFNSGAITMDQYTKQLLLLQEVLDTMNRETGNNFTFGTLLNEQFKGASENAKKLADASADITAALALIGGSAVAGFGGAGAIGAIGGGVGALIGSSDTLGQSIGVLNDELMSLLQIDDIAQNTADVFESIGFDAFALSDIFSDMNTKNREMNETLTEIQEKEQRRREDAEDTADAYERQLNALSDIADLVSRGESVPASEIADTLRRQAPTL